MRGPLRFGAIRRDRLLRRFLRFVRLVRRILRRLCEVLVRHLKVVLPGYLCLSSGDRTASGQSHEISHGEALALPGLKPSSVSR